MRFAEDISINTIIGLGSSVHGDIKINGFIRIDGDVDGDIETSSNIIIGEKARIRGNITALSATVGGIVEGDITAKNSIKLLESAAVLGDVTTKKLQVEENVILHGHCIAVRNEDEFEKAANKFRNQKAIESKIAKVL